MSGFEVIGIYIALNKGDPMQAVQYARAIPGRGLEGDRYERGEGSWSRSSQGTLELTIFTLEALNAANNHPDVTEPFLPEHTRRNIMVRGGPENLCTLAGKLLIIGKHAIVAFTEECDPCTRPSRLSDRPFFREAFRPDGRGGIRTKVLVGGVIHVGDLIRIENK